MVELLAVEKRRLLAARGHVTTQDFDAAWEACWEVMVLERAWPHATCHRRSWRAVQWSTRSEFRAAFLDEPTAFATATRKLAGAASGMCLQLEAGQYPQALLAAIAYAESPQDLAEAA
jgi:hypothetical protein